MDVQILESKSSKAIGVVQFRTAEQDTFLYKSASYAIKNRMIEVKEVSDSGSVNDLFVINYSDFYVFFMDGDILKGAKQNRVLNTSVLLKPHSKTVLPVSCVEAGRWRYSSSKFDVEERYSAPPDLRFSKAKKVSMNLECNREFSADQREIWNYVEKVSDLNDVISDTSNLSDVFCRRENDLNSATKDFEANKEANGIAVFVNGKLSGVDVFNRKDVYEEYFTKILNGIAMETNYSRDLGESVDEGKASEKVQEFLKNIDSAAKKEYNAVGAGTEKRFDSKDIAGFELYYEKDLIHMGVHAFKRR